ncbi:alpha-amylase family protein [Phaeobacter sp. J2-8]|uniref:alpha-amylase family protein n=1 Tax=Phaeobacter sp. J2-8 TaxID=2931394 RepID=UPI001FD186F7|nr:alpha-amylase family protein [Phaeobacter sp. J2-8]MCJ7874084.1 beta-galactosidase trimerization domain-containing protein [Phaeobacter sp. J2-8]
MNRTFSPLRYRQIHLDFHTSEAINGIGADFDAEVFGDTLVKANVDSITIFARCHHGWSYYPSEVGPVHPGLARPDLLGEMVAACRARDIETPIYITVQWDEYIAREHPEWRVMSATNASKHPSTDVSASRQLTATWHTVCLSHQGFRDYILASGQEVARKYAPPGLFFDIVNTFDCVCPTCVKNMETAGLDPERAEDRAENDRATLDAFRKQISDALWAEFPDMRIFYNAGHIHKRDPGRYDTYSHLEIESLPTGGWGWNHFPSNARYAVPKGFDTLGQTGKFHTMWGEFGGFKSANSLDYECAQMAALGTKCLIGDQLHPDGVINADTYARLTPAYARIKALEPWLKGAQQLSDIGILSVEHFGSHGARKNNQSDDGATQMMLELHLPFDMLDSASDFDAYPLLILPDDIPVGPDLAARLKSYLAQGGRIIASGRSGLSPDGGFALPFGIDDLGGETALDPTYLTAAGLDRRIPESAVVVYAPARKVALAGGTALGEVTPPYANRTWRSFCSHQHFPDDPNAAAIGPGIVATDQTGYLAWPIFDTYKRIGQPIYKYAVAALIDRLLPSRRLVTDLPSNGRASVTRQEDRTILHLLYGGPQVRGVGVDDLQNGHRHIEVIEDIPRLGPLTASVALDQKPARVVTVPDGTALDWDWQDGRATVNLDGLHIHRAIAFETT